MEDTTPIYNLKAVMRETGLGSATLRAWERRYGLLKPQRSAGGHRLYSEQEIAMLKWLVARQQEGLSISHAVELWQNMVKSDQNPFNLSPALQTARVDETGLENLRSRWISACLDFNELLAEQVLAQLFTLATPEAVCTEVLQKGLAEIGERWYQGTISVQQEHFASALAMRRLYALFSAAPRPTRPGRLLAACPPGEIHEFSLLLLAFILRQRGWGVIYLGANVPLSRLDRTLQRTSPRLVLSVAQTLHSAASLLEMAGYINQLGIHLAYGGGIFNAIPVLAERIPGYFLGQDLSIAPQVIEQLLTQPPALPQPQPLPPKDAALLNKFVAQESAIFSSVSATLQTAQIDPHHLEEANIHLTRYITAALSLGDIHFLDSSVGWLNGLLENYGFSPALSTLYYVAFRQAVQRHLGDQAAPILDWLAQFERD